MPSRSDRYYDDPISRADPRDPFQIDLDRVLYSTAFRRLAGITQVVDAAEGHVFHNRLTHSLKVAHIGRRLSEYLVERTSTEILDVVGLNADCVAAACLCHDLGHPPFGHIAEAELNDRVFHFRVPGGFEGNAQSFRIVANLSIRRPLTPGMNLTVATLNALLKYPWPKGVSGKSEKKWGYYGETEAAIFEHCRSLIGSANGSCKTLEACIMDWADDVAYSVHDLDDFYRAGFIPLDRILAHSVERDRFLDQVKSSPLLNVITTDADVEWAHGVLDNLNAWCSESINEPFIGQRNQIAAMHVFSAMLISRYLGCDDRDSISVDDSNHPRLRIAEALRREVDLLKSLMHVYVYNHPDLVAQQEGHRRIVSDLFDTFFESVIDERIDLIPHPFRETAAEVCTDNKLTARLVADVISSMTEQQAITLYQRISGLAPGSVSHRLTPWQ